MDKTKKRLIIIVASSVISVFVVLGIIFAIVFSQNGNNESGIYFENNRQTVEIGATLQLDVKLKNKKSEVVWSSNDEEIATVNETGLVSGLKNGNTIIKATIKENDEDISAMCLVKVVSASAQSAVYIELQEEELNLLTGSKFTLSPVIRYGKERITPELSWTVQDTAIASVENGIVKGLNAGETTVKFSFAVGEKRYNREIYVKVKEKGAELIPTFTEREIANGGSLALNVFAMQGNTPISTSDTLVSYTVDDTDKAEILSGNVLHVKSGQSGDVYVTAKCTLQGEEVQSQIKIHILKNCTVRFWINNEEKIEKTILEKGTVDMPNDIARDGKYVSEWLMEDDKFDFSKPITDDISLQPVWKDLTYDFKQSVFGACAMAQDETNDYTVTPTQGGAFIGGLRYPIGEVSKGLYWSVALPVINYSAFKEVAYDFSGTADWMAIGFEKGLVFQASKEQTISGTLTIVRKDENKLVVILRETGIPKAGGVSNEKYIFVSDLDIINGKAPLTIVVNNGAAYRHFDISAVKLSVVEITDVSGYTMTYDFSQSLFEANAISANGTQALVRQDDAKFSGGIYFETGSATPTEWTISLPKIDYRDFDTVSYKWTCSASWMQIGLTQSDRFFDGGSGTMSGSLEITRNADGTLTVVIKETGLGKGTKQITITDDDVVNGVKQITISVKNEAQYRNFYISAASFDE